MPCKTHLSTTVHGLFLHLVLTIAMGSAQRCMQQGVSQTQEEGIIGKNRGMRAAHLSAGSSSRSRFWSGSCRPFCTSCARTAAASLCHHPACTLRSFAAGATASGRSCCLHHLYFLIQAVIGHQATPPLWSGPPLVPSTATLASLHVALLLPASVPRPARQAQSAAAC